jgi:hypothetical protein
MAFPFIRAWHGKPPESADFSLRSNPIFALGKRGVWRLETLPRGVESGIQRNSREPHPDCFKNLASGIRQTLQRSGPMPLDVSGDDAEVQFRLAQHGIAPEALRRQLRSGSLWAKQGPLAMSWAGRTVHNRQKSTPEPFWRSRQPDRKLHSASVHRSPSGERGSHISRSETRVDRVKGYEATRSSSKQ